MIVNDVILAVDTSYEQGAVALFRDNEILFERTLEQKFSHGQLICAAIDDASAVHNNINAVMVGLGPGSFVGVRIALATALGFCFARNLPLMGFCSHDALSFSCEAQDFAIYMKASGELGYLTLFNEGHKVALPRVVALDSLQEQLNKGSLIFSDQTERINAKFPNHFNLHHISGPQPTGIVTAARERLALAKGLIDERSFIKPNYVKAPSVSLPATHVRAVE